MKIVPQVTLCSEIVGSFVLVPTACIKQNFGTLIAFPSNSF